MIALHLLKLRTQFQLKTKLKTSLYNFHRQCCLCLQSSNEVVCRYCYHSVSPFITTQGPKSLDDLNLLDDPNLLSQLELPQYDYLFAIGPYQWPLDMLVLNMKFHKKMYASKALCNLFDFHVLQGLSAFTSDLTLWPEVLIPVPLSNKRHRERGYNQAQLLCDELSRITNIPNLPLLRRTRHTQAQSELNRDQRLENLQSAFSCRVNNGGNIGGEHNSKSYRHIAIVDDVITTGATINEACQAILAAMPHVTISVWCMSLTLAPLAPIAPGETPDAN